MDVGEKLVFPNILQTTLRPDIVIWSQEIKCLAMVELTVPSESRCGKAYERKAEKYAELQEQCREKGWRTWLHPVEIGARGFLAVAVENHQYHGHLRSREEKSRREAQSHS